MLVVEPGLFCHSRVHPLFVPHHATLETDDPQGALVKLAAPQDTKEGLVHGQIMGHKERGAFIQIQKEKLTVAGTPSSNETGEIAALNTAHALNLPGLEDTGVIEEGRHNSGWGGNVGDVDGGDSCSERSWSSVETRRSE